MVQELQTLMLDLYIEPQGFLSGTDESTLRKGMVNSYIDKTLPLGLEADIFQAKLPPSGSLRIVPFDHRFDFGFAKWLSRSFLVIRDNLNDMDIPAVLEIDKKEAMLR